MLNTSLHFVCESCNTDNSIDLDRLDGSLICDSCGAELEKSQATASGLLEITDGVLDKVKSLQIPFLLDFWAPWCGPCRMQTPVLEALAEELGGKVLIGKINTDENRISAMTYRISAIPTLVIFHHGKQSESLMGLHNREQLLSRLAPHLE